jgi:cation diffusion facilitator family transporter
MTPPIETRSTPEPPRPAGGHVAVRLHRRAATLSLIVAVVVLGAKTGAWLLTGSVGLASDAAESIVNVVAASTLLVAIRLARTPPDYEHPYGHEKVEDLSSAFEAGLILLAATLIAASAVGRLIDPEPLVRVGPGLALAAASAVVNGAMVAHLFRVARQVESQALRANARHLRTDVWTSAGVLIGVGAVAATGWLRLDPAIALIVAGQIAREGVAVLGGAISRLLDERLPDDEERAVLDELAGDPGVLGYHRLRSRRSGRRRFVEVDVFVDPGTTVAEAHARVARLEDRLARRLPNLVTTIHVEPYEEGRRDGAMTPRDEYPPD